MRPGCEAGEGVGAVCRGGGRDRRAGGRRGGDGASGEARVVGGAAGGGGVVAVEGAGDRGGLVEAEGVAGGGVAGGQGRGVRAGGAGGRAGLAAVVDRDRVLHPRCETAEDVGPIGRGGGRDRRAGGRRGGDGASGEARVAGVLAGVGVVVAEDGAGNRCATVEPEVIAGQRLARGGSGGVGACGAGG